MRGYWDERKESRESRLEVRRRGGSDDDESVSGGGESRRLIEEGREGLTLEPARSRWSLVAVNCMS